MNDIKIRRPELEDRKELQELFRVVVEDTFKKEGFEDLKDQIESIVTEKNRYLEEDYESSGEDRFFLLAEIQGKIVGTIESGPASKLLVDCTKGEHEKSIEIGTAFIIPESQGKGIGSLLLKSMCIELVNNNINEVCVESGYKRAGKVWRKIFGKPTYIIKDYWTEGYDHLIWCNKLEKTGEIRINS